MSDERDLTDPNEERLCEFYIEGNGLCPKKATVVCRPKNPRTMLWFGRGLYCDEHAHVLQEEAEGSREWEIEQMIDEDSDLERVDLSVSHPSPRGPFMGDEMPEGNEVEMRKREINRTMEEV